MKQQDKTTLFDRFALGSLTAVSALLTFGVLSLILLRVFDGGFPRYVIEILLGISIYFFLLGFFTMENIAIKILSPLLRLLDKLIRKGWWF